MTQISYYNNLTDKQKTKDIELSEFCDLIRTGAVKDSIQRIRTLTPESKDEISNYKKRLPAVTVSGIFNHLRKSDEITEHSGLIQVDFDHVENLNEVKQLLLKDKYTFICFVSPTGTGIKVIVKIPNSVPTHLTSFKNLEDYYKQKYGLVMDKACKDVSRLCFLSYDPEIYRNDNAEIFSDLHDKSVTTEKSNKKVSFVHNNSFDNDSPDRFENLVCEIENFCTDITGDYDQWLKIGFAIADSFGESGRQFFHRISKFSAKYNSNDTDKQYAICVNSNNGKVKLASVFHFAQQCGISLKNANKVERGGVSVKNDKSANNSADSISKTANEYDYYRNMPIDKMISAPIPQSKSKSDDVKRFGIFSENNTYWVRKSNSKGSYDISISNFVFSILFQFDDGTNNTSRLLKWYNADTDTNGVLEITDKELNSISDFSNIMLSKNCIFKGSAVDLKSILQKAVLFTQKATFIKQMGYNAEHDLYAFSNAIVFADSTVVEVNSLGLIQYKEKLFYLPQWAESNLDNSFYSDDRKVFYNRKSTIKIADYFTLMTKAYGFNGSIASLYVFNSLMYDIVFDATRFFPYLFLFGEPGCGKTSLIDSLLSILGKNIQGVSVKGSTFKGTARKFSQYSNWLVYLKEYDNDISTEYDSLLKTAYDGNCYTIAQKSADTSTSTFEVKSGIVIDGNVLPVNQEAVFDRVILLELREDVFTIEQTQAYEELLRIQQDSGFSNIVIELFSLRKVFLDNFKKSYNTIAANIKQTIAQKKEYELKDRSVKHNAFLLATLNILSENKIIPDVDLDEILNKIIIDSIEKENSVKSLKDTSVFWTAFSADLKKSGLRNLSNKSYSDYILEGEKSFLFINMQSLYNNYVDYCNKMKLKHIDLVSMRKFLTNRNYKSFYNPDPTSERSTVRKNQKRFYQYRLTKSDESNSIFYIDGIELVFDDG